MEASRKDGGFSEVKEATEEVQQICDKVSSAFVNIISLALCARCPTSTLHKHLLLDSWCLWQSPSFQTSKQIAVW